MSEVLNEFPGHRRNSMYLWDEWFDGKIRKLFKGIDFHGHQKSMRCQVYIAARRRGLNVRSAFIDGDLIIQASSNGKKR